MSVSRRADLDWLRVLAFGLLIAYHAGMAWSGWSWHLTSVDSIDWLREGMRFVNRWRMPLIFVVSGAAITLALGSRSPKTFALDRVRRLLVPLLFGMVVIVPPQIYLERLYRGQFTGSFFDWLPQVFQGGAYPNGNLSWHHLWFLAYVLVLTFVLLPYFLWARSEHGRAALARAGQMTARFGLQWLMVLPLAASILWLAPISYNTNGLIGDWHGLVYYGALLLCGAFLFGSSEVLAALNRQRWLSVAIGVVAYGTLHVFFFEGTVRPTITDAVSPCLRVPVGDQHHGLAVRHHRLRQPPSDEAPGLPRRRDRGRLSLLHPAPDGDGDRGLLAAADRRAAGRGLHPGGAGDLRRHLGDLLRVVRPLWFLRPLFGLKAAGHHPVVMKRQPG